MNFLKTFGAWAIFTCLPPMVILLRTPGPSRVANLAVLFSPFLLIAALGSLVLLLPVFDRDTSGRGLLAGVLLGIVLPILLGFVWMRIYPGFENGPTIFLGSLLTAPPCACGGALAGWLRSRSK
jgi:hypothetical protein